MAKTAADVLIETLQSWGVEVIFGLPGDGINGIMESLRQRAEQIRFIQVRHEESAAFMACAYAKYTGRLGVCLATSGPGGLHLLNGLYDAKLDGQPVLAITGHHYHDLIGTFVDLQSEKAAKGSERNVPHHASDVFAHGASVPCDDDLRKAAEILNSGRKVLILAGRGALGCGDLLEQAADRLGAPIVKALLGKAAVPDDSPFTTGGIGLLGTRPSQEAMEDCDTLLLEFYPKPSDVRAVQIDVDPGRCARPGRSATAAARSRNCCRSSAATTTAGSSRKRRRECATGGS